MYFTSITANNRSAGAFVKLSMVLLSLCLTSAWAQQEPIANVAFNKNGGASTWSPITPTGKTILVIDYVNIQTFQQTSPSPWYIQLICTGPGGPAQVTAFLHPVSPLYGAAITPGPPPYYAGATSVSTSLYINTFSTCHFDFRNGGASTQTVPPNTNIQLFGHYM